MRENRRYLRVPLDGPAFITIQPSTTLDARTGARSLACSIKDISLGGLRVSAVAAAYAGDKVQIVVPCNDPPCILRLAGVVSWVRPEGAGDRLLLGINVAATDGKSLEEWRLFVRRKLPPAAPPSAPRAFERDRLVTPP